MTKFVDTCRTLFTSPLVVVDIGAAGGVSEVLSLAPLCEMHAVEPRDNSYQELVELNEQSPYLKSFSYSKGLAKVAGLRTLHVTKTPEASSLYAPNTSLVSRWRNDGAFDVVSEVDIDCTTLEDMLSNADVDYVDLIKIDTQGSELDILLGAGHYIDKISIIKCEIEFVELYTGQPLFDDVVRELSKRGFRFVDFFDGGFVGHERENQKRIWGDAIFIKKKLRGADELYKAAAILVDMDHCEEAKWLFEDHGGDLEAFQLMVNAQITDRYPNSVRFKKILVRINDNLKSVGTKNALVEKVRQSLIRQLDHTKFVRALTWFKR
jgi:FkbM family methyltransferase